MRLMYNIILFSILMNLSVFLIQVYGLSPAEIPAKYNPFDIAAMFTLETFVKNFMWAGIGVAAGIVALLFRQGTYAVYALAIFAVSAFIPIVNTFIFAVPNMIDTIMYMYPEYNPFSSIATGVFAGTNPISLTLIAVATFAGFMFLMENVTGRNLN
jgi:hypothetical protein